VIDAASISVVLDVLQPERAALLALLEGLRPDDWQRPTECPAYTVKGIATHVLGDDLSLLSRQRDAAQNGLSQLAPELPARRLPDAARHVQRPVGRRGPVPQPGARRRAPRDVRRPALRRAHGERRVRRERQRGPRPRLA
jgi:uncharacterized protein (TIGR03083 family)